MSASLCRTGGTRLTPAFKKKTPLLIKVIGTKMNSNAEDISQEITTNYFSPPLHINKKNKKKKQLRVQRRGATQQLSWSLRL